MLLVTFVVELNDETTVAFVAFTVQLLGHTSWYVSGFDKNDTLAVQTAEPAAAELNHVDAGAAIVDTPDDTDEQAPDELRNKPLSALRLETVLPQP